MGLLCVYGILIKGGFNKRKLRMNMRYVFDWTSLCSFTNAFAYVNIKKNYVLFVMFVKIHLTTDFLILSNYTHVSHASNVLTVTNILYKLRRTNFYL